jgi:hypothetical protein
MNQVNSQDVFTSYGGLEVRFVANKFALVKSSDKVIMTRHPSNLYRDAEVKTCIQNFSHRQVVAAAADAKAAMPDISVMKNNGNVSQGVVGATTSYDFKAGKTAFVSLDSICKQEKGSNALSKLSSGGGSNGRVKVSGGKGAKSKSLKKSVSKKVSATGALMRSSSANNKKSAVLGARGPNVQSPGNAGADGSANISSMKDFKKMVSMIKNQKNRGNTPGGKRSKKN